MSRFKRAIKEEAKLRLALAGPSGSGKTYTALKLAEVIAQGKGIALIDTENHSASKYADEFSFDVVNLEGNFHPDRYVELIQEAVRSGYEVLVIDSLTHAWNGPGGVLEIVEQETAKTKGNSYVAWRVATPIHNKLIRSIVECPIHVIVTMRSKTEYVLVENEKGRLVPQKVGMAPEQRANVEYEFDVVIDMDHSNTAIINKSRCKALAGAVIKKPGREMAETLLAWLQAPPIPEEERRRREIVYGLRKPQDAYAWAVDMGRFPAEEAAREYFGAIVARNGGRLYDGNLSAVMRQFVDEVLDKLPEWDAKDQEAQEIVFMGASDGD